MNMAVSKDAKPAAQGLLDYGAETHAIFIDAGFLVLTKH